MKRYLALSVFLAARLLAQTPGASPAQPGAAQTNYLADLLHKPELGWTTILIGMIVAFGLGAVHALSPGHGKTIVAAYLVGTRGTPGHAIFLGAMVTFTHTISVFLLGLATLFLSRYVLPEKIFPVLGVISGVSIVWIGAILLYQRIRAARRLAAHHHHEHAHTHDHAHAHIHEHAHAHLHGHGHEHTHEGHPHDHTHEPHEHHHHGGLVHDHGDGHVHSHMPDEVSLGSLIALGASGGLVPCPSALVLLLSAIALGRVGLGLILLVAFSLGLAGVLMAIGLLVLYAKNLLPDSRKSAEHPAFRLLPVASAAVIVCIGLIMTAASLGIIRGPLAGV
jgi:ABC-type nickel/cobalt efflux system permease component RcnA